METDCLIPQYKLQVQYNLKFKLRFKMIPRYLNSRA